MIISSVFCSFLASTLFTVSASSSLRCCRADSCTLGKTEACVGLYDAWTGLFTLPVASSVLINS